LRTSSARRSRYRPGVTQGTPPAGAADQDGFVATGAMTSLVGCAGEDFASILRSLGYVSVKRPGPAITVPLAPPPAATEPAKPVVAGEAEETAASGEVAEATGEADEGERAGDRLNADGSIEWPDAYAVEAADALDLTETESAQRASRCRPSRWPRFRLQRPRRRLRRLLPTKLLPLKLRRPSLASLIEIWRPHRHRADAGRSRQSAWPS
jgi:ATP-dependent RNA helicase SUPV3L1/SUV3